jgi:uncharacterized membrane protein YgcG
MKTIRLFIIAFFTLSTLAHAAENQSLSQQAQENVRQMTQEMSALGIPEVKAQKMLMRMHQNRFQHQNIVRAQQAVMDAAKEGLPTEPIINKAMEGMVKQAKEQQVIKAMEAVRSRHEYAYRIAKSLANDKKTTETMAGAIADGLAAGMAVQDMDRIAAQLKVQTRQQTKNQADNLSLQTMQTVRTMARLGSMTTDVSDTIHQALQHQYTSRQMEQLRHNFSHDAQQTSARQLARQYAGSIGKDSNPGNSNDGGSSSGGSGGSGSGGNGGSGGSGGGGGGSK